MRSVGAMASRSAGRRLGTELARLVDERATSAGGQGKAEDEAQRARDEASSAAPCEARVARRSVPGFKWGGG